MQNLRTKVAEIDKTLGEVSSILANLQCITQNNRRLHMLVSSTSSQIRQSREERGRGVDDLLELPASPLYYYYIGGKHRLQKVLSEDKNNNEWLDCQDTLNYLEKTRGIVLEKSSVFAEVPSSVVHSLLHHRTDCKDGDDEFDYYLDVELFLKCEFFFLYIMS